LTGGDEHGGAREIVGRFDRPGADLVVGEQLDRAFGAAAGRGDEDDGLAAGPGVANRLRPVANPAVILDDGHGRDVRRWFNRVCRFRAA
jgi:hypothetical protein